MLPNRSPESGSRTTSELLRLDLAAGSSALPGGLRSVGCRGDAGEGAFTIAQRDGIRLDRHDLQRTDFIADFYESPVDERDVATLAAQNQVDRQRVRSALPNGSDRCVAAAVAASRR